MKKILMALAVMFALPTAAQAEGASGPAMSEQDMVALYTRWDTAGRTIASEADLPAIMALLHDDFRYIHVEYEADMDREGLADGLRRRLARAWTRNSQTKVTNMIAGKNMLVVKYDRMWEDRRTGEWVQRSSEGQATLFEFRGGKIWRITEYWE